MGISTTKNYEKGKLFRDVQVWPLSTELDYEGWLGNFSNDSDRTIAEQILDFFTYYSKKMVNQMLSISVGGAGTILKEHYADWTHKHFKQRCIYSFIPGETPNESDSGHIFIRKIREVANIPQTQLIGFHELFDYLEHNSSNPVPVILVDDIIGSGLQCKTAWCDQVGGTSLSTLKEIAQKYNHKFIYAPLIINRVGFDLIKSNCPELFLSPAHIIGEEYNLFNEKCICWSNDKELFAKGTEMILRKSAELGIKNNNSVVSAKGFRGQGLAIAFEHGIPDAVPAFFYWESDNWVPLIKKSYER
ncbi:hypothetical protein D0T84_15030 [Dysgonomonas sp. 521]|uniref:phosphoribosyltransferase-like protein n=1 Tax=Dysgonomonas sp. 521 TaxID=2302932 RepID=UPI0013CFB07F|nr:hypothetical protein [Dysgonomonas sp. 521]NDV96214.1 hypothetical protein [Dysgonomonas sp. 521]